MTLTDLVARLELLPHPEGGWYRETFRAPTQVPGPGGAPRAACTQILYALGAGDHSAWHRVSADELWQHHEGAPLELHVLQEGVHRVTVLGSVSAGYSPQGIVPAGAWQAARPVVGEQPWALVGCTVAPGFDFDDFEMAHLDDLLAEMPHLQQAIRALGPLRTRP